MNYIYLIAISILSLKELNYELFLIIFLSLIVFFVIFYFFIWYYNINIYDGLLDNDSLFYNDDNLIKKDTFDNLFPNIKTDKFNTLPDDSDDEENISISISDIKYIDTNGNNINIIENKNEKFNIIPLKKILNNESVQNINDLLLLAKYYENNILNKNDKDKEYLKNNKLYKYGDEYFTINLEKIYKIQNPLIKLKKMVGLTKIKNDIVDLLLYYLINFNSDNNMLHMTLMGPPGCGKTKLAKIISQILNKMEILYSDKIVYAKSTDLIAQYVGQTGPKTQKVIDSALGGVLFIDEAYGLGNSKGREHNFGAECINVLNQNLSDNKNKFICIIAGYEDELEELFFSVNPGLKRRFPFKFTINGYSYLELMQIFIQKIYKLKWKIDSTINLEEFFQKNYKYFKFFGGDIDTLIQNIKYAFSRRTLCDIDKKFITMDDIICALNKLKSSRHHNTSTTQNKDKLYKFIKKML